MSHLSQDVTIAYSSERKGDISTQLGNAHYSYVFVEYAFIKLLNNMSYKTKYLKYPQNIATDIAFEESLSTCKDKVVHISIRSTENIRILKGTKNVAVFFWEFPVMRDHGLLTEMITHNQKHMLSLVDEVWVGCKFTKNVLEAHGIKNVFVIPPPIYNKLPKRHDNNIIRREIKKISIYSLCYHGGVSRGSKQLLEDISSTFQGKNVFLTILNPNDLRKNLINLIEGFQIGSNINSSVLIIKLISNAKSGSGQDIVYQSLKHIFGPNYSAYANNIYCIADYISDLQMQCLYSMADFYLCASYCEGLNMPLLEAMSYGVIPVTTASTAMLDYINKSNSIIINSSRVYSPVAGMAGDISGYPFVVSFSNRFDIANSVNSAEKLSNERRLEYSSQNLIDVQPYGYNSIQLLVRDRIVSLLSKDNSL